MKKAKLFIFNISNGKDKNLTELEVKRVISKCEMNKIEGKILYEA